LDIQNPPVSLQEYQNSTTAELEKLSHFVGMLIPPDSTCVIFGAGNDRIALVVERAGEYFIRMTF
jgi:TRAP-type C4-dicarboxylate transport system permease large subunit